MYMLAIRFTRYILSDAFLLVGCSVLLLAGRNKALGTTLTRRGSFWRYQRHAAREREIEQILPVPVTMTPRVKTGGLELERQSFPEGCEKLCLTEIGR